MKLIKLEKRNCNPCKTLDLILEGFGVIPDEKYELMSNPDIAIKYKVMQVPVLILVDEKGNEVERLHGTDEGMVKAFLERAGLI